MPFVSDTALSKMYRSDKDCKAQISAARKREATRRKTEMGMGVALNLGAAGAMGWARGLAEKKGASFTIGPVDIQSAVGVGLIGASFFNLFGKMDYIPLEVGKGVMAHYMGQIGRKLGVTGQFTLIAGSNDPNLLPGGAYPSGYYHGMGDPSDLESVLAGESL